MAARYGLIDNEKKGDVDPGPFSHVWEWFIALHRRREFDGAAGVSLPITWQAIKAWSEVTETPLATHEIRLLCDIDDMFVTEERRHRARQAKNKGKR